jgi:coproporphyrinogen III oxidase-like Fe-S oxidoreductase
MNGTPCIGMGVNACSVLDGYITRNTNNCALYIKNAGDFEKLTAQVCAVDQEALMRDYAYGRLGLTQGLSEDAFEERFETKLPDFLKEALAKLAKTGWIQETDGIYTSTRQGYFHYGSYKTILEQL